MAGVNILYGRTEGRVKRTGKGEPPPHWKSFRPAPVKSEQINNKNILNLLKLLSIVVKLTVTYQV